MNALRKLRKKVSLSRLLVPLGIIAFALVTIFLSSHFERMPPILKRGIQPSDFPQLVAGLIIFLALLSLFFEPVHTQHKTTPTLWMTLASLLLFTLFVPIDFFLALGVCAFSIAFCWHERRPLMLATVSLFVPLAVFFFFDTLFSIRFPRGLLTNLWYG